MNETIRQRLYDLKNQRAEYIAAAEQALAEDNQEAYRKNMDKAKGLNERLDELQADLTEAERYDKLVPPAGGASNGPQNPAGKVKTVDDLKGMSAAEINKHWAELLAQTE